MKARLLSTHLIPEQFQPDELRGGQAVVIDILRASSTIVTALFHGAATVIPCLTIEQARQEQEQPGSGPVLLGGERGGLLIPGFDLGNSPRDYTEARVAGKTILFTTTNGTKALHRCAQAERVLVGCFLNLSGIVAELTGATGDVHLVCAGTDGQITLEDCLFAGTLAQRLIAGGQDWEINDGTRIGLALAEKWSTTPDTLHAGLLQSRGGRNLARLGLASDVAECGCIDERNIVPSWKAKRNRIDLEPT